MTHPGTKGAPKAIRGPMGVDPAKASIVTRTLPALDITVLAPKKGGFPENNVSRGLT
jgi:hypothetical protein